jgi:hypothetical protein
MSSRAHSCIVLLHADSKVLTTSARAAFIAAYVNRIIGEEMSHIV